MNYFQKIKTASGKNYSSIFKFTGLFIAYKSYCMYQHDSADQIISYKPIMEDGRDNTLVEDSGLLVDRFRPSFLVLSGLGQSIYGATRRGKRPGYQNELLKLPDGGQIRLQSIIHPDNDNKGVVVIIPGITGDGYKNYVINTAKNSIKNGYSVYIVNHRGLCDTPLSTPLTYHGGSSFDTKAALEHIVSEHPDQPIYGVGYSLGSNILGNYIGEEGENCILSGAALVCCPFKTDEASKKVESSNFGLISRWLARCCKKTIQKHEEMYPLFLQEHNIELSSILKEIKKLRDFDDKITAKQFGYSCVMDYYQKCSIVSKMKNIKIKTLFISALDDPFFGPDVIPHSEFQKNENLYLIATSGGGHVGFHDTVLSKDQWHNKPMIKFFNYLSSSESRMF
ncbi:unnamed protein product [Moneuplotes crassus]|uniref:AB hydrolase-1 domain-containing protein n=1 Tax=Euplotes crassus TaxID=5936 RepID=A0AAD1UQ52_EUPCR|nr:unnamed protein product [Moneuplotes crassus]